ncbi:MULTISPECIES: glycosyl transferase family 2 [Halomicrobium]|uniref:Glycosyltransferase-like protein n=2 Tax=Halomicrobium mukohataei TaxID=57705 RepID=C7P1R0_HALMD|nr:MULTISPECIES: glycosyl transferase family 2 [Halomicrobium]ACV49150.1 glycosyltransferase-like protein [Halomicrobium mukohataei DSM 12286]QCD64560.1 glycosyl transferase family 2 [Halomicrobium mukohataei]QFR19367.1 glycosyl transferase family 2 [Halomicrobium sp. ZPS1]
MEYVQERIATLHDYDGTNPAAPTDRAAVVVPMTEREHASLAAEHVFSTLASVDPEQVYVPLRAGPGEVAAVTEWIDGFDFDAEVLWCNAPRVEEHLRERDLVAEAGKGRDVWLALGVAARHDYVVVHDADATSYGAEQVPKLLAPLAGDHSFAKGYYARVEDGRLYGRLFRLFVRPLLRALDETVDHPVIDYLLSFRYALAGEFAATSAVARSLRAQPGWGLEIGTLGDAYDAAGFAGSAQVDLGTHEHDHRSVGGPSGLGDMCEAVGGALFRVLDDQGVAVEYDRLRDAYTTAADALVDQYAADARFNGLTYDAASEREQVREYVRGVADPGEDRRLPAWDRCGVAPETIRGLSRDAIDERE